MVKPIQASNLFYFIGIVLKTNAYVTHYRVWDAMLRENRFIADITLADVVDVSLMRE